MDRHDLELPMLEAIHERLEHGAREHGDKDMAATYLASAPSSRRAEAEGLEFPCT
jgi:3-hydroxyisobutyrate dehydrogenase